MAPNIPVNGIGSAAPDEPVNGTEAAAPDEPVNGTEAAAPDEPVNGTEAAAPDEPVNGTEAAAPDEPVNGIGFTAPVNDTGFVAVAGLGETAGIAPTNGEPANAARVDTQANGAGVAPPTTPATTGIGKAPIKGTAASRGVGKFREDIGAGSTSNSIISGL